MFLRVLIILLPLLSITTFAMDLEDQNPPVKLQHSLKPDTFVFNPDFFDRRITLSRIITLQRMIDEEFPRNPPNSPIQVPRSRSCWDYWIDFFPSLIRGTIALIQTLK